MIIHENRRDRMRLHVVIGICFVNTQYRIHIIGCRIQNHNNNLSVRIFECSRIKPVRVSGYTNPFCATLNKLREVSNIVIYRRIFQAFVLSVPRTEDLLFLHLLQL